RARAKAKSAGREDALRLLHKCAVVKRPHGERVLSPGRAHAATCRTRPDGVACARFLVPAHSRDRAVEGGPRGGPMDREVPPAPGDADRVRAPLLDIGRQYAACTRCAELGVVPDSRRMAFWHMAESARPARVRVLFVAESPPRQNRRGRWSYFYLPHEQPPGEDPSELFWA